MKRRKEREKGREERDYKGGKKIRKRDEKK